MPSIVVSFNVSKSAADLLINKDVTRARDQALAIDGLLVGLALGQYAGTFDVIASATNGVKASGTLTIAAGTGAVGGTIGGTLKTVTWATSDTASAAALAAAINTDATINKLVTASSAAGVVTLTANMPGPLGNKVALVASGTGVTASGATLANGVGADGQPTTYSLL
ncbi:MAG TPA: hypothetical protein VFP50_18220 [Anaeromyxobacteraceae bacterium]|nr:hypothetical protein [Anaeromyxobacteraceae bacterium]